MMTDSDICALCGGKLREGFTELVLKAGDDWLLSRESRSGLQLLRRGIFHSGGI